MTSRDLFVLGCAAGIGFTVALFVATVAFRPGPIQDAAKMGALGSFAAAIITWIVGKIAGVERVANASARTGHEAGPVVRQDLDNGDSPRHAAS